MSRKWAAAVLLALAACMALGIESSAQDEPASPINKEEDIALDAEIASLSGRGKYTDAIRLAERLLKLRERVFGSNHPKFREALDSLAELYRTQARFIDAETLYRRALQDDEKLQGIESIKTAATMDKLATIYFDSGHYSIAEGLYRKSLAIKEKLSGRDDFNVAASLASLAALHYRIGQLEIAESLYQRRLAILEKSLGPNHPALARTLQLLAATYERQTPPNSSPANYLRAERLLKRALEITEKAPDGQQLLLAGILEDLAEVDNDINQNVEAEAYYHRAIQLRERHSGRDDPSLIDCLVGLSGLYQKTERYSEAEQVLRRVLTLKENSPASVPRGYISAVFGLGLAEMRRGNWSSSAQFFRLAVDAEIKEMLREEQTAVETPTAVRTKLLTPQFLLLAGWEVAERDPNQRTAIAGEMFKVAQWARRQSSAVAIARMAARFVPRNPRVAAIIRDRQDTLNALRAFDRKMRASASMEDLEYRRNQAEGDAVQARLSELNNALAADFPGYEEVSIATPLSASETQALLRPNEALVAFLTTSMEGPHTFIWVVTNQDIKWVHTKIGADKIEEAAALLRCGVDFSFWKSAGNRCQDLLKATYTQHDYDSGKPLPFDLHSSYFIYKDLFEPVADAIDGKQLLIVPSGELMELPFNLLVAEFPGAIEQFPDGFRRAAWLIRRNALTIVPAVSSLKALRAMTTKSRATMPMVGFGNPLILGSNAFGDRRAVDGVNKQYCDQKGFNLTSRNGGRGGIDQIRLRQGVADVELIRRQAPLPETADELCAVARKLDAGPDDIFLGARATETQIKRLSAMGRLAQYRLIHFATHGAIAGEVRGNSEPGLLLTPPKAAISEDIDKRIVEDDGYLTSSEVADLRLDADWVVLSACNTAAGDTRGGDALSGLARAFFYAGARSLLVSHWSVDSDATVKLVTDVFGRMESDKAVGRSEALRQSMLALIDKGGPREMHPSYWAPFVVVGEGGTNR